jgi:glycosyltransferase involved in cell wall biosynthesis
MAPDRIHRVALGVDAGFFAPGRRRAGGEAFTVITVGNWQRDFRLLEQVVWLLHDRGERVRFIVVCPPRRAAHFGGLPSVEAFSGVTDAELRELYRRSDALFLPLVQAAASNTLLEGMASGLPVIATDLPGVREYVAPGCARLVGRFDHAAAADAIVALAGDPDACARLGEHSRRRAEALDWELAAPRLADVYRSLLPR